MSGIAGVWHLDGRPVERADVERMLQSMARRGPDGSGTWQQGAVGLGHCMLWTTPESLGERQPLTHAGGDLVISADARIDNRAELIGALDLGGRNPGEIADSQLILAAYEKWGEACPAKLLGDFAFAIWDGRRRILFCARDYFGVKPFYYYHRPGQAFVFASEVKALLSLPQVPRRINEGRIADYLVPELEGIDKTCTFYQEIFRLPPAQSAVVSSESASFQTYWALDPTREVHCASDAEYVEAFREIFTEAVRCRLRSAGRPACMLSGGLDSSSIVGVARQVLMENGSEPLLTFSAVSEDGADCAETRFINMVLGLGEIEAHKVRPGDVGSMRVELAYVPHHADDLFDTWMALPQMMYVAARRQGVNVLLDGVDGNLVASLGTGYLAYLLRAGMWKTAVAEAMGTSSFYLGDDSAWALLYRNSRAAFVPPVLRELRCRLRRRNSLDAAIQDSIIRVDFARRIDLAQRLATLDGQGRTGLFNTLRAAHANTLERAYITVALERYDRVAAAYSVEARHPFFDKRLVEFCLALPWEQKVRRGWTKAILRRALAGSLPEAVRWRRGWERLNWKFASAWIRLEQGLLAEALGRDLDLAGEYVDVAALRAAYGRYMSGREREDDENQLWRAATLVVWLRCNRPRPPGTEMNHVDVPLNWQYNVVVTHSA